jgi:S1-C subfamily serine protease
MALHAICPNCQSGFTLPDEVAGKKVRCKSCQVIFAVHATPDNTLDELEVADPEEAVQVLEGVEEVGAVEEVEEVPEIEAVEEVAEVEEVEAVEPVPRRKVGAQAARPTVEEVEEVEEAPARPMVRSGLQKGQPALSVPKNGLSKNKTDPNGRRALRSPVHQADDDSPAIAARPPRSHMPLILGSLLGGLVILVGGGIVLAVILRGSSDSTNAVANAPPPAVIIQAPPAPPLPPQVVIPVLPAPQQPSPGGNTGGDPRPGKITQDSKEAVKQATVYIRVTMADGSKASGSGFFGCAESPNLILTNAHVVGMLSPDSLRPQKVEVVINGGQPDEDEGQAQVLGVDRSSDLAVLELYPTTKKGKALPSPILVKSADKLTELDEVYVFGYPLGERLGKEITIRNSTVSSLRKVTGTNILDKIQVNGGMDPGNSGGPVVDASGGVVGVAVSGIQGRMINFAIPGDRVHTILNGRISEFGTGQPFFTSDQKIGIPVTVVLLDPRNLVKDVSLDVWTGDAGKPRGPSKTAPEKVQGDSNHARFPLTVNGRERKGELVLPPLPDGKVYWVQPAFTNGAGETHWVAANVYKVSSQPVERKPADLVFKPAQGQRRELLLTNTVSFKLGDDEDSLVGKSVTKAWFDAKVESYTQQGALATLSYLKAEKTNFHKVADKGNPDDFKPFPSKLLEDVRSTLNKVRAKLVYDGTCNLTKSILDPTSLAGFPREGAKSVQDFHKPLSEALNSVAVPLPNKTGVAPQDSWKATRTVPIETPDKLMVATYNLTYTYLGQRERDNRTEAVISIAGDLQQIDGKNVKVGGSMSGTALVDLGTGEVIMARTNTVMEQQVTLRSPEGPLTMNARISTETRAEYGKPR